MIRKLLIPLLSLTVTLGGVFYSTPTVKASDNPEVAAKLVVQKFFDTMSEGNFAEATELVVDLRYPSKEKQIAKYKHYNSVSDFESMKIIDAHTENESTVVVTFQGNVSGVESKNELYVKESEDEWKLILGDDDPATVAALNVPEFSTHAMVDYYSFTGFNYGRAHYTINSFSTQGNAVSLIGWQYASSDYHADVSYQVAQDSFIGWKTFGNASSVYGNYTSAAGDRFTISLTGVPKGNDYHIRIVNWAPVSVDGAGNVYTN
ncbi:hypothetical protein [Paenibacillus amylolyticus]|uniref:hypothetical protein n=1 Tax=Paenibacillus TaxID=44249 RepID=UPI00105992B5|nr:hypothetical protein [Paenibacillus amylolyticus]TDL63260.1 hypothetical protein E2R58_24710 [Paenibacillus amylolyticus]